MSKNKKPSGKEKKVFKHTDEYVIRFDRKEGDYWKTNFEESIFVDSDLQSKGAHSIAEKMFLNKHIGEEVKIVSVSYV